MQDNQLILLERVVVVGGRVVDAELPGVAQLRRVDGRCIQDRVLGGREGRVDLDLTRPGCVENSVRTHHPLCVIEQGLHLYFRVLGAQHGGCPHVCLYLF